MQVSFLYTHGSPLDGSSFYVDILMKIFFGLEAENADSNDRPHLALSPIKIKNVCAYSNTNGSPRSLFEIILYI